ncbi:MAG: DUF3097 domain-containing protein [Streptosporangiales bacterium]|nr:DUF3097 domain-containing protein [Streptosporangiales bacterium]MBO0890929.1 DUF3097 domain-containing protein [Acidothermales bacterium]
MAAARDYGRDVLAGDWRRASRRGVPEVAVERGMVVEEAGDGFCGAVVDWAKDAVVLEDRHGRRRRFPWGHGYLLEGEPVALARPAASAGPAKPARTASGSVAVPGHRARVARESRIYVEGMHDAELVERVWGDDLRIEGVVVEPLHGVDDLPAIVREFGPQEGRRLGVLVDHLVPGSKESRVAASVTSPHVLVVGHPFVDVWQAVRPAALGIERWPDVPRPVPWKEGVCRALGWPACDAADLGRAWRRILDRVHSYADLEPALLGRVEELIDFVTAPGE